MHLDNEIIEKLILSVLIGAAVGTERELRSKSAGFRTLMLICLGATLFTIFSRYIGVDSPSRIASNIVVGIGFVGAGVIFRGDNRVNGITTAATIWLTAALGMGIGAGYYSLSITACVLVLVILFILPFAERFIDKINQVRNYKIVYPYEEHNQHKYEHIFLKHRLKIKSRSQVKAGNIITGEWIVQGTEQCHHNFIARILQESEVTEFAF